VSKNGDNIYNDIIDDDSDAKLPLDGDESAEFQYERVTLNGLRTRTLSYEFKNEDVGVNVVLLGYTQEFKYLGNKIMNIST
jgi:hypothetical protein